MKFDDLIKEMKFDERGLIPCIVQEAKSGDVLMVAYMNRESLEHTLEKGESVFWSRSRKKLWHKGETSGNVQKVKELRLDCDGDCLLLKVDQIGDAACHKGYHSCFYRVFDKNKGLIIDGEKIFDPEDVYGKGKQ